MALHGRQHAPRHVREAGGLIFDARFAPVIEPLRLKNRPDPNGT